MRSSNWILLVSLLMIGQVAQAGIASVYNSDKRTTAGSAGVGQSDNDNSTTFGTVSLNAVNGSSNSAMDINWVDTGTGALFDHDINLAYNGNEFESTEARDEKLRFTISADTTYDLSGLFSVTDNNTPAYIDLHVSLRDLSTNSFLFLDRTVSASTGSGNYVLGNSSDGDSYNNVFGNLSGALVGGHAYQLSFRYGLYGQAGSIQDSSATGCVTLSIGGATGAGDCGSSSVSVPAPASSMLLLIGLAGLFASRRTTDR